MNLAQRYPYGGRWANHRIEHGKKNDFHMGCSARRETISFGFSLQIRVFLKAQKKKRIYGALINIAKWKKKKNTVSAMKKKNNVYESRGYSLGVRHIH